MHELAGTSHCRYDLNIFLDLKIYSVEALGFIIIERSALLTNFRVILGLLNKFQGYYFFELSC